VELKQSSLVISLFVIIISYHQPVTAYFDLLSSSASSTEAFWGIEALSTSTQSSSRPLSSSSVFATFSSVFCSLDAPAISDSSSGGKYTLIESQCCSL